MNSFILCTADANGEELEFDKGLRIRFVRELYTPYAALSGEFICSRTVTAAQICRIRLLRDRRELFCGIPDRVTVTRKGNVTKIAFAARSYTSLTAQNEPEPGIISDVDLAGLVRGSLTNPYIVPETGTPVVDYIYVKPGSSLWDSVVAYNIKASNRLPYIHGSDRIMSTKARSVTHDYSGEKLLSGGFGVNTVNMLSDVHMRIGDGEYQYNYTNPNAAAYRIKRSRYYELDRQWLYNINLGLEYKAANSNRRRNFSFFQYPSFKGEELFDKVSVSGTGCDGKYISRVELICDPLGCRTKVSCYDDGYAQK